jgi:hypothetical protein
MYVVATHLLVAWLLLLGCLAGFFVPAYFSIRHFVPSSTASPVGVLSFVAIAVVGLLLIVTVVYGALHLFLWAWFSYLSRLEPTVVRAVEKRLPSVLNVPALQPQYTRVRNRFTRLPK